MAPVQMQSTGLRSASAEWSCRNEEVDFLPGDKELKYERISQQQDRVLPVEELPRCFCYIEECVEKNQGGGVKRSMMCGEIHGW